MTRARTIQSIYTDGACSGNPGGGGWGNVIYFSDGSVQELGGAAAQTTNNRMELQAAIAALEFLLASQQTEPVTLYTDSEYVKNGITRWVKGWKQKGWKTSTGKPVLNQDLWELLDRLYQQVKQRTPIQWQHVRGHSGDAGNDRCDAIARAFALGQTPILQQATTVAKSEIALEFDPHATNQVAAETIQSRDSNLKNTVGANVDSVMVDSTAPDVSDVPREVRVAQLRNMVETLHMADEVARQGYLITSSELADLMDVNASAVTSRGDNWVWRNWVVSRVRREGNQILWQLERVD
ncbi:MAG: ribonuclease HI [Synechococcales cyanobacterium C42_A2020_086]|jgi:ribonuclease HI|nr:ribonuclease HI [Synechococcales cyanobacterium C42_A2020_086]